MHRYLVFAIVGLLMITSSAFAEDRPIADAISRVLSATATTAALNTDTESAKEESRFRHLERPWPLPFLYASSAFLQSYDTYLTLRALDAGASEANPVLKHISAHPIAFIAVKTGVTATAIVGAEQLWKDHHRKGAVALMVVSNAVMLAVAAHNSSVIQQIK